MRCCYLYWILINAAELSRLIGEPISWGIITSLLIYVWTLPDQWKKGQPQADWKYNKNNLFTMSHDGYGKEGGEFKRFNGVKGKPGQEKGKCNIKSVIKVCIYKKGKANVQVADLTYALPSG